MKEQLSPDEIKELESMANAAERLPKYSYYVQNYYNFAEYKDNRATIEKLSFLENPIISNGSGCIILVAGLVIMWIFAQIFQGAAGIVIGFIVAGAGMIWARRYVVPYQLNSCTKSKEIRGEMGRWQRVAGSRPSSAASRPW
jgi:hypothetical protein